MLIRKKFAEFRVAKVEMRQKSISGVNGLTVNIYKTVYMTFGCYTNSVPDDHSVNKNIDNITINRVESYKYLFVTFDLN